jgi:LEA14-like dessication related protein
MHRRYFPPAVLAIALSGCATLQRPIAPEVIASRVRLVEAQLPEIRLAVELTLRSRNVLPLPIDALDATLSLAGLDVGRVALAQPVTLPAYGEAPVALDVRADAAAALARIAAALRAAAPLEYELAGTLRLADGTSWPFRRRGAVLRDRRP